MIYLFLAIFSSFLVSFLMRLSTGKVRAEGSMLAVNYLTCSLLAAGYCGFGNLLPASSSLPATLGWGLLAGVLYLLGFVLLQKSMASNGVVLSATFMKLGLLVPMVMSVFLFGELPTALQITGFCIAVAAIILINYEKGEKSGRFHFSLILLLLAGGGADAMSKVYEHWGDPALSAQFLFFTFGSAFLVCLFMILRGKERPGKSEILFGMLIGIPNFYSSRFLLQALTQIPAVIIYPCFSVGTLLVVTLSGVLVFREKLKKNQWLALGAILAALVLLNL